jgi:hypothetical protein
MEYHFWDDREADGRYVGCSSEGRLCDVRSDHAVHFFLLLVLAGRPNAVPVEGQK